MIKGISFILMSIIISSLSTFAQPRVVPLYSRQIPNSKPTPAAYAEKTDKYWITQVSTPTLTVYMPDKGEADGTAVVICPGGGYAGLASGHEGGDIAVAFNKLGVTAFVLKYRLPSDQIMIDKSIGPLQDAQRALQLVRERAGEWGINPNKIGIIGFSAGGHLASTVGTHFDKAVIDSPKQTSLRPDFMVLLYPVISFGEFAHSGSRENLVGKDASQAAIDLYSNEKQVTPQTPPTFLVHAQDDKVVPVQNSLLFYQAMVTAGVKGELHIYEKGGHGFGLNNQTTQDLWFDRLANWLKVEGWIN